jgi:uncharacterized membrane protein
MNDIEPSEDPQFYKWGVFYYNPNDERILVPKRIRAMGWTFNFARQEVYLFVFIVGIIIWLSNSFG